MSQSKLSCFSPSFALATLLGTLALATPADASVSIALSIDDVARIASTILRATPVAQSSAWEGQRIVTTTRLKVDRTIAGASVDSEITVQTLGGAVDGIGQRVEGEAALSPNVPSIVFLRRTAAEGPFLVAGRAQGQLVVTKDARSMREIVRVRGTGALVPRPQRIPYTLPVASPLVTAFDGRDAEDAVLEVAHAWERTHAR
jgi:hypothetical protein